MRQDIPNYDSHRSAELMQYATADDDIPLENWNSLEILALKTPTRGMHARGGDKDS